MRGCRARSFSAVNGSSEKEKVEVEVGLATRGLAPALPDFGELSRAVPVPLFQKRTVTGRKGDSPSSLAAALLGRLFEHPVD
jgi:hypothetical protein